MYMMWILYSHHVYMYVLRIDLYLEFAESLSQKVDEHS